MNYALLRSDPDEVFRFIWDNAQVFGIDRGYRLRVDSVRPSMRVGPNGLVVPEVVADYVRSLELTAAELARRHRGPARLKPDTRLQVWGSSVLVFDQFGRAKLHQAKRLDDWHRQSARIDYLAERDCSTPRPAQLRALDPARTTLRRDARRRLPCRRRLVSVSPYRITVRMYQVGFGDCFLLSFAYSNALPNGRRERHILIDFGSTRWPKNYPPRYRDLANDIALKTGGKLDVLVITHRHKDHLGGFGDDTAAATIATLQPSLVLRPGPRTEAAANATGPALVGRRSLAYAAGLDTAQAFAGEVARTLPGRQQGFRANSRDGDRAAGKPGCNPPPGRARGRLRSAGLSVRRTALRHRRDDPRCHDEGARTADDRPVASRRRAAEDDPDTGSANAGSSRTC